MTYRSDLQRYIARFQSDDVYRRAFWKEKLKAGVAAQVRELRASHDWSQEKLARIAAMRQPRIAEIENPDDERELNVRTLMRLADAFDVVLDIDFISYGTFAARMADLSPERLSPPSFENDPEMVPPLSYLWDASTQTPPTFGRVSMTSR